MEKIIWIIIATVIFIFAAGSLLLMSTDSMDSVVNFSDSAEDIECQTQADIWESGDSINQECIKYLDEADQEEALASSLESEIT